MKCVTMSHAIDCICCHELSEVEDHLEESNTCITSSEAFKIVCSDKDVLYTSLVTMHSVRGDKVRTPISNSNIDIILLLWRNRVFIRLYRLAAYR